MQYIETVGKTFQDRVQLWYCHAGLNTVSAISLTEEHRLRLALGGVEALRRVDPRTPLVVSFDQPWGEYLRDLSMELTPLHYADAIVRSELAVSGIGLELNVGYWPHGSPRRDLLQLSQLIERWAMFGLPLVVSLTAPGSMSADDKAELNVKVTPDSDSGCNNESQNRTVQEIISLLLLKPSVQVILWDQLLDSRQHRFPHAGLFDGAGKARPVLETFRTLRGHFRD